VSPHPYRTPAPPSSPPRVAWWRLGWRSLLCAVGWHDMRERRARPGAQLYEWEVCRYYHLDDMDLVCVRCGARWGGE
jgi:hypothetical protein